MQIVNRSAKKLTVSLLSIIFLFCQLFSLSMFTYSRWHCASNKTR